MRQAKNVKNFVVMATFSVLHHFNSNIICSFPLLLKGQNTIRCAYSKFMLSCIKFCYRDMKIFLSQLITAILVNYFHGPGTKNVSMATKF